MRPLSRRHPIRECLFSFLQHFLLLQYTCADVSNEMKVLEQEVFPHTVLKVLKRPLADMLEVHWRIEEITDTKDLHAHAATTPFEVLTAFDFLSSVES